MPEDKGRIGPGRMTALAPDLEGTLIAHRRMLEALAITIAALPGGERLIAEIEDALGYDDQSEDPGAEPDPAYAAELAADAELRRLLRSLRDAIGGRAGGRDPTGGGPAG